MPISLPRSGFDIPMDIHSEHQAVLDTRFSVVLGNVPEVPCAELRAITVKAGREMHERVA